MRRLRTASTRHILTIVAAVVLLAVGAGVARAALGGASAPPAKALDRALYDAARAPDVAGISARIHFTNDLLPSGSLPEGQASPIVTGADGRLWLGSAGQVRLELQSDGGDAQIVADGNRFMVYDASSNTAYAGTLSAETPQPSRQQADAKPTLAAVDRALARLGQMWTLSGAKPGTTADRPSYTVRISPKDDGGLLGAAELAWDAARGVPLRAAIYAQGQATPVLELAATHISYGALPAATFSVRPPAGAKVTQISAPAGHSGAGSSAEVTGASAVARAASFPLATPKRLAGLPLQQVRLVKSGGGNGALSVYGQGLGAIVVLQSKGADNPLGSLRLPRIAIGKATGSELATALGTVLTFQRNGVSYVVAGSVPPLAAENAARGLR